MPQRPFVFAATNTRPLCLFCPLRPPPYIKASVRRVPTLPQPQSNFHWTPAQMSTDSPSLSPDLAHDPLWQLAPWAQFQTPPTPLLSLVPYFAPPPKKNSPHPRRRRAAKTGTATNNGVSAVTALAQRGCSVVESRHMSS